MRYALLVIVVPLLQVTVVNRFSGPDLAVLVTAWLAIGLSPPKAAVFGFAAGLLADLVPPAAEVVGPTAAILCLTGYLCARLSMSREPRPGRKVIVVAVVVPAALLARELVALAWRQPADWVSPGLAALALSLAWTLPPALLLSLTRRPLQSRTRRG
ncbi:hypothetical protein ACIBH1_14870 [Nonomuraea sp. NPDC050663]|uniref:hypothetical protein n=1 Tax=Nonomuraea sp. NPDC050663 TaxID=3364370 RepID=UPI0037A20CC4